MAKKILPPKIIYKVVEEPDEALLNEVFNSVFEKVEENAIDKCL